MNDSPSQRRAVKPGERAGARLEHDQAVWRIGSLEAARQVLRARQRTTQAGFTAEKIPKGYFRHHPILISDGPLHDEQRSKVARFFAPAVVAQRYPTLMEESADALLGAARAAGSCRLDELALQFSVEVTAEIVGLTHSPVPQLARRLESFFTQPPLDISRPDFGRTRRQWLQAAVNGLVPIVRFYFADVRPAVRARRRQPREDVISHLIAEGYSAADLLVECVTYGTAGMVTTREFISMACWHLLTTPALKGRYLAAGQDERHAILNEIIRLEPVVGHLYRRAVAEIDLTDGDRSERIAPGELIDICVRQTNADPHALGDAEAGLQLCPGRRLPAGVNAAGLSFGDGAHRCPGQPLAIWEADVLLTRLLAANPRLIGEPKIEWDNLIEGYRLREVELVFEAD